MKRTVYDCDICNNKDIKPIQISIFEDRRMDAAGSMEDVFKNFDLCPTCSQIVLSDLLRNQPINTATLELIKRLKERMNGNK